LYDPALHRFLQPDNYVQDLFNTQNFNRYGYCLNNPLLYTDPTGEWFVIDDVIVMLVGGAVNLTINAIQGNVTSFWNGLGYFVVGVGAGAASLYGGPLAGGAVLGFGNNITTQVSQNGWSNIDWTSAIIDTGIGIGTAYIGGQFSGISSRIFKDVSSPVLRNVLISGTSNAASGFVVSGGASYIMNGDVDQAFKDGLRGGGYGLTLGTISGFVQGFQYAREKGVNPWNGRDIEISNYAEENGFYSLSDADILPKVMDKYYKQMESGTFNIEKGGAGYIYKNKYYFEDGHHKMNAAIKYFLNTGNDTYIKAIIKKGNFGEGNPYNYRTKVYPFRTLKK